MATRPKTRRTTLGPCIAIAGLMTMTACAPQIATRGNLVEDERLAALEVGFTTEDEVATLLGTPTTISTFEPDVWYYIGQRTRQRAFFEPEIIERRVLMIDFDANGVIESLEELDLEDAQSVELASRETPTLGRRLSFLEQMLGNFGRQTSSSR